MPPQELSPDTPEVGNRARRRLWFGLGAASLILLLVAGFGLLANSRFSLNAESARQALEQRLSHLAGRPVTVEGDAGFQLLPRPVVQMSDVFMQRSGDDNVVHISHVIAELDLLDALFGKADIDRLTLIRPQFGPADDAAGPATPQGASESAATMQTADMEYPDLAARYLQAFLHRFDGVREVQVRDGVFQPDDTPIGISSANLDFEWNGGSKPATLNGRFVWNGQPADVSLTIDDADGFLEGTRTGLELSLTAAPLMVRFNGAAAAGRAPQMEGRLQLETTSMARLSRWLGHGEVGWPDFGDIMLDTQVRMAGDRAFLNEAQVTLDEMRGQGALEVAIPRVGQPMLAGTLAFENLNFDTLGSAIAPLPQNVLDLQRRIPIQFVRAIDLDLRLSSAQTHLAGIAMNDLAATVKFSNGAAVLDIGDAEMLGGRGQARFSLDAASPAPRLTGTYSLQNINAAQMAAQLHASDSQLTGTASIQGKVELPVTSWGQIARTNRITAEVTISNGTLAGLPASQRLLQKPGQFVRNNDEPPTTFEKLTASLSTYSTFIRFDALDLTTAGGKLALRGLISLADSTASLDGVFLPADTEFAGSEPTFTSSKPIEFTIQGEWPELNVIVAPRSKPI